MADYPTPPILAITGPTACGKTARAVELARRLDAEIISADSRQLYRGMDLGTGKDLDEYGDVPYHMIDIAPSGYKYNLFEYLRDAQACARDIASRNRLPLLCGGTGLYVEGMLRGMQLPEVPENPELRQQLRGKSLDELTDILGRMQHMHNTTDVDSARRAIRAIEIATYLHDHPEAAGATRQPPRPDCLCVVLDIPRDERRNRISRRLKARFDEGMVDEIRSLIESGVSPDDLIYYGLEYKFITRHVIGELTWQEMYDQLEIAIHQFAKRQMTWFRGMERRGFTLHYLPYDMPTDEMYDQIADLWRNRG